MTAEIVLLHGFHFKSFLGSSTVKHTDTHCEFSIYSVFKFFSVYSNSCTVGCCSFIKASKQRSKWRYSEALHALIFKLWVDILRAAKGEESEGESASACVKGGRGVSSDLGDLHSRKLAYAMLGYAHAKQIYSAFNAVNFYWTRLNKHTFHLLWHFAFIIVLHANKYLVIWTDSL